MRQTNVVVHSIDLSMLSRQRQVDCCKSKVSQVYTEFRLAKLEIPVSAQPPNSKQTENSKAKSAYKIHLKKYI